MSELRSGLGDGEPADARLWPGCQEDTNEANEESDQEEIAVEKMLLTPEEAAQVLSLGRTKVYELMRAGVLRSVRIDTCRRVPIQALVDYIAGLRCGEPAA